MAQPAPIDPYTGTPVSKTDFQQRADDPAFAKQNPALASLYKYRHGLAPENQLGYGVGNMVGRGFDSFVRRPFEHFANKGPLAGGLAGALPLAALGALGTMGANAFLGTDMPVGRNALLLGLLGGGMGAWSGQMRTKNAAMYGASLDQKILAAVQSSGGLSLQEQAKVMQGLRQLSSSDKQNLWQLIASASGAAIGALVLRFLGAKGAIATGFGAVLGGMLGNSLFTRKAENSSLSRKDFSGRAYAY
jgi:hypothetical protein